MKDKRFKMAKVPSNGMLSETRVIVDKETGVQYLFVASGYAGGLTILVDRDGKPLLEKENQQS